MGAELDLDDVAATSVKAKRELGELRDELDRLKRYVDGMNYAPGGVRHRYFGLCPEVGFPNNRDPDCPACRLLMGGSST